MLATAWCTPIHVIRMDPQVLDKNNPFSQSHVVHTPAKLLQWLTPRADGFHVLNLILDVEVPWENEVRGSPPGCIPAHKHPQVVACRRALWFVMTNTILPILGLCSATLREVHLRAAKGKKEKPETLQPVATTCHGYIYRWSLRWPTRQMCPLVSTPPSTQHPLQWRALHMPWVAWPSSSFSCWIVCGCRC